MTTASPIRSSGRATTISFWVPPSGDCIDLRWTWPPYADFLRWLGSHGRVISFDRRGAGASDAPSGEMLPSWERWADDALAVLDEVGSERAVICGAADAGPTAVLFAASHPSRTRALILMNTTARFAAAPDYPMGVPEDALALAAQFVQDTWGTGAIVELSAPDLMQQDQDVARWFAVSQRLYLSPRAAAKLFEFELSLDVRDALGSVRVPTLVLHREGVAVMTVDQGRYLAEHIAGARLASVPGNDGSIFTEPVADAKRNIEEFLASLTRDVEPDRALSAVLFTDIVESTARAAALGDRAWRNLLETHHAVGRTLVEQHRGRIVKTTGDGLLATFDGPGRAIRCALALREALRPLGLDIRAGLHTGEVEVIGADIAGIAVHIAARVMSAASPGEVLVSPAVPMLVAGSGIDFDDRGEQELKGVPGAWRLYAVEG